MARNRWVWVEFWGDKKLASVSRDARLTFIGIWNFSDDYGVVKGNIGWIKSNIFEEDESATQDMVTAWVKELIDAELLISFKAADCKEYLYVKNWTKYQKVDKPSKRRNPRFELKLARKSRGSPETVEGEALSSKLLTPISSLRKTLSGKPDDMSLAPVKTIKADNKKIKGEARIILEFLNKKTGREYRINDTNLAFIEARLKSGATTDNCRAIIARKFRDWAEDENMAKYLRPATLFNKTKFEQYLGECVTTDTTNGG